MARKTREESENTRVLILQSALDSFYEKGFSRTTFDDIAFRINLTKGAVYWHFKNKADLLAELIVERLKQKNKHICGSANQPQTIADLREYFKREAEYLEKNPELQKFFFFTLFQVEWSDGVFNQVLEKVGDIRDFHFKTINHVLTIAQKNGDILPKVNVKNMSILILSTWRGLINSYVGKELKFSLSQTITEGFDAMIGNIRNMKG